MDELAVINASPLILLGRAGLLGILREAGRRLVVPVPVGDEILRRGAADPVARFLQSCEWLELESVPDIPTSVLMWNLGPGESAVLAYALVHQPSVVVIDDLAGRRCAAAVHLPVRGTLGLVLLAKKRGHIEAARPALERLRLAGMYLSPKIVEEALRLVGE